MYILCDTTCLGRYISQLTRVITILCISKRIRTTSYLSLEEDETRLDVIDRDYVESCFIQADQLNLLVACCKKVVFWPRVAAVHDSLTVGCSVRTVVLLISWRLCPLVFNLCCRFGLAAIGLLSYYSGSTPIGRPSISCRFLALVSLWIALPWQWSREHPTGCIAQSVRVVCLHNPFRLAK